MPPTHPRLTLLPLLLLALSCDRRSDTDTNTLRFINRGDIFTLDLNQMSYGQDIRVTYLMREGLYSPTGPQYTPKPAGAVGCDISADKLVYTFHLRHEARWSNGDPVTTADYLFSWRYMLEQPGEYTYLFYYIKGAEAYKTAYADGKPASFASVGLEAVDPYTLKVSLTQPVAYLLDLVAFTPFYPRNQASMKKFEETDPATGHVAYNSRYTRPPDVVCNGPFVLKTWEFKHILRFVKSPSYWDAASVKVDEVDMLVNDNVLSTYLQYKARAIDWVATVQNELAPDLKENHVAGLRTSPAFGTEFLTTNCSEKLPGVPGKNPLADVRVRQALAMAIDKAFITDQITRMGETPATHYIPPGTLPGFTSLPGLEHDPAKARQLLADAGYPEGRGFPRFSLLYNSESTTRARIVQVLKQQWQQVLGIDLEIEGVEGKSFTHRVSTHDFAIATVAWYGDYADVSTFTDKYQGGSLQNDASWVEPKYDALLKLAAAEPDVTTRFDELKQAEMLLNTEVPIIPLYHPVLVSLLGPRVRNMPPNARGIIDWKAVDLQGTTSP